MALLRLGICVIGVYSMFLLWAIAQERLSVPFANLDGSKFDKFHSPLFMSTCQSILSSFSAVVYLWIRTPSKSSYIHRLGLGSPPEDSHTPNKSSTTTFTKSLFLNSQLLLRFFQCAVLITAAAPFGFAALSHISYPAMVLGKSCKLVPVMLMNLVLYRRRFAPHKYLVVALVTLGITIFMGLNNESSKSSKSSSHTKNSLLGMAYLMINLILDGVINSTQDEIFVRYKISGQQMMFWINLMSTLVTSIISILPLPFIPVLHPSPSGQPELSGAVAFIREHPSIIIPLAQFAVTGAVGQLFIFETLQHFGSLTLVTITLTRKLFTMLLSVIVYNHRLTLGQWVGAAIVFIGISVEAWVKRKDIHAKRVVQEQKKAKIKNL